MQSCQTLCSRDAVVGTHTEVVIDPFQDLDVFPLRAEPVFDVVVDVTAVSAYDFSNVTAEANLRCGHKRHSDTTQQLEGFESEKLSTQTISSLHKEPTVLLPENHTKRQARQPKVWHEARTH